MLMIIFKTVSISFIICMFFVGFFFVYGMGSYLFCKFFCNKDDDKDLLNKLLNVKQKTIEGIKIAFETWISILPVVFLCLATYWIIDFIIHL